MGTRDLLKTEFILSKRIDYLQQSIVFGTRHKHTFHKAAERHLKKQSKTSLREDKRWIKVLDPYNWVSSLLKRSTMDLYNLLLMLVSKKV